MSNLCWKSSEDSGAAKGQTLLIASLENDNLYKARCIWVLCIVAGGICRIEKRNSTRGRFERAGCDKYAIRGKIMGNGKKSWMVMMEKRTTVK
ncbi:hypothetical protein VNO80_03719 [Phaseolus coccineus]|uniref:Uncharacterized protein n=1 Tax=Phaseolus coccineus TaxID=3886 RepID=A0AAN9NTP7_PHACN